MEALLTFDAFQRMNAERCEAVWHPVAEWPIQNWALAIAGEAGELANLVKKVVRGDLTLDAARQEILKETADVLTYSDLLVTCLGARTDEVVMAKFREVSQRVGYHREIRKLHFILRCNVCQFEAIASTVRGTACPACGRDYEYTDDQRAMFRHLFEPAESETREHPASARLDRNTQGTGHGAPPEPRDA